MSHPSFVWILTKATRHKSLIAYLSANNLPNAAAALRAETSIGEDTFDVTTAKKYEGLLEKKWTSVVRLQKKVRCPRPQLRTQHCNKTVS